MGRAFRSFALLLVFLLGFTARVLWSAQPQSLLVLAVPGSVSFHAGPAAGEPTALECAKIFKGGRRLTEFALSKRFVTAVPAGFMLVPIIAEYSSPPASPQAIRPTRPALRPPSFC
jgi:hypothetical protein